MLVCLLYGTHFTEILFDVWSGIIIFFSSDKSNQSISFWMMKKPREKWDFRPRSRTMKRVEMIANEQTSSTLSCLDFFFCPRSRGMSIRETFVPARDTEEQIGVKKVFRLFFVFSLLVLKQTKFLFCFTRSREFMLVQVRVMNCTN